MLPGRATARFGGKGCVRTEQVAELLARPPLFLDAPEGALAAVAREASIRTYRKGSIVVSEGEPADACYIIAEGSAKVSATSLEGGDLILATLRPPDAFGVIALLDGGFRSASVEALEPLTLAAIARRT
jgi:CRP/FNR family transcriptional regulator, cyclic AMP receptor protein